jgi:hypothetical protein
VNTDRIDAYYIGGILILVLTALLLFFGKHAHAQQQVRLCFNVTGSAFCTVATATNKLPTGAGTGGAGTGTAPQVRLCYALPNSPFCQVVDAAHPLPIQ